jgi:hypothetical protein
MLIIPVQNQLDTVAVYTFHPLENTTEILSVKYTNVPYIYQTQDELKECSFSFVKQWTCIFVWAWMWFTLIILISELWYCLLPGFKQQPIHDSQKSGGGDQDSGTKTSMKAREFNIFPVAI